MANSDHPTKAVGWAARDASGLLSPFNFSRRATGEHDVQFKVVYCGVCHSDLHMLKNDWGITQYPIVPGHEIVGEVTELGSKVVGDKFKVGDKVSVGCIVGSCRDCDVAEAIEQRLRLVDSVEYRELIDQRSLILSNTDI